jgi:hypothetical protein
MSVSPHQAVFAAGGLAVLLAAGTLAVALNRSSPSSGPGTGRIANAAYSGFTDCEALLGYYRSHGHELVGPYGLPGASTSPTVPAVGGAGAPLEFGRGAKAGSAADSLSSSGSGPAGPADPGTGTNVQVAGVDEADVAKRSGDLLLTVGAPPGRVLRPMPSDLVEPVPRPDSPDSPGSTTTPGLGTSTAGLPVGPGLRLLRTTGNRATLLGVLPTPGWSADQLLVRGSTVLLLGPAPSGAATTAKRDPAAIPPTSRSRTRIAQVDVADPAHPRLLRTLDVDGNLVGARLSGGVARLAVSSPPGDLHLVAPQPSTGESRPPAPATEAPTTRAPTTRAPTTEAESLAANRKLIAASSLADWLPRYTLVEDAGTPVTPSGGSSGSSGVTPTGGSHPSSGPLLDCTSVAAPTQFSGLDTLSLLSFDLGRPDGITSWNGAAVVATGTTLYATAEHTYVTTAPWQDWQAMSDARLRRAAREQRTWIHEFVTTDAGAPRYLASGSVPGFLVNQYALDEYRGDLRVASTEQPRRLGAPDRPMSSDPDDSDSTSDGTGTGSEPAVDSSQVTVLRADGDRLTAVGSVGRIGRDEQIRGVRFIGPVGYVVTFRQTDPLFTIDLSDPARPRVAGELKLLGYSAYLHPAGDGLLLGVGQSADAEGRREGLQLSLFDVSDAAAPRRLANVVLPGAVSTVESDAHAFTFSDQLALIPYHRTVPVPVPRWTPGVPQPGMEPEMQRVAPGELRGPDSGVVAVRVDGHKLSEPSVLRPHGLSQSTTRPGRTPYGIWYPTAAPLRTFVDGEAIWTVTQEGIGTHQLPTLRWLGFTTFHR